MKIFALNYFIAVVLSMPAHGAHLDALQNKECTTSSEDSSGKVVPTICYQGQFYEIKYIQKSTKIVLVGDRINSTLHQISRKFDPSLVGGDVSIGFLPEYLQIYRRLGMLLYLSSIRTTGGDGGGYCGAGAEISLQFLDMKTRRPKFRQGILIGSCRDTIELVDQNVSRGIFGAISVVEGRLNFQFMNYGMRQGYPVATLSDDFKALRFY